MAGAALSSAAAGHLLGPLSSGQPAANYLMACLQSQPVCTPAHMTALQPPLPFLLLLAGPGGTSACDGLRPTKPLLREAPDDAVMAHWRAWAQLPPADPGARDLVAQYEARLCPMTTTATHTPLLPPLHLTPLHPSPSNGRATPPTRASTTCWCSAAARGQCAAMP